MKINPPLGPNECLMRVKRPDGTETWLRFDGDHLERVMELAEGEFGDKSISEVKK